MDYKRFEQLANQIKENAVVAITLFPLTAGQMKMATFTE